MASSRVNRPMNLKQRDADISQKLQLYGIATAFQNGKLPSNDQIDSTLNSFIYSDALTKPSSQLSTDGHKLVADVREVVNQAKYLLLSKNQGDVLQDFIWQTSRHDFKSTKWGDSPVTKDAAKEDGQQALQGLKTLGNLLITNGQFRKLCMFPSSFFFFLSTQTLTTCSEGCLHPLPGHGCRWCHQGCRQGPSVGRRIGPDGRGCRGQHMA